MFCVHCGKKLDDDARFCSSCGKNATEKATREEIKFCKNCGTELEMDSVFCSNCGTKVLEEKIGQEQVCATNVTPKTETPTNETQFETNLQTQMSPELIEKSVIPEKDEVEVEHWKSVFKEPKPKPEFGWGAFIAVMVAILIVIFLIVYIVDELS